jgi:hypothetical protein
MSERSPHAARLFDAARRSNLRSCRPLNVRIREGWLRVVSADAARAHPFGDRGDGLPPGTVGRLGRSGPSSGLLKRRRSGFRRHHHFHRRLRFHRFRRLRRFRLHRRYRHHLSSHRRRHFLRRHRRRHHLRLRRRSPRRCRCPALRRSARRQNRRAARTRHRPAAAVSLGWISGRHFRNHQRRAGCAGVRLERGRSDRRAVHGRWRLPADAQTLYRW